jgi:hypothetical protein
VRRMINPLRTAHTKARPRPAMYSRSLFAGLAILAGAFILTPRPSLAGDNVTDSRLSFSAIKGSSARATAVDPCHLDLNDRMKMDVGTWGSNIVHPHGPNYFCVERHKQLEQQRHRDWR